MAERWKDFKSTTFCILPWLHLGVRPTGRVRVCTWTTSTLRDTSGRPLNIATDSLFEALDSIELKQMKEKMLAGEQVETCARCYEFERVGNKSKRLTELDVNQDRIDDVLAGKVARPEILELRLGNKCNLGCISCSPDSSSFLFQEIEKNQESLSQFESQHLGAFDSMKASSPNWYEGEEFWSDVEKLMPHIRRVYITGGEPSLIKKNWEMLANCVEKNLASKIELEISTNLTALTDLQIDILNQFFPCHIYCSLDAVGEPMEYLRYPAKWSKVEKNFFRLVEKAGDNVTIGITPTISSLSIWRLKDLYSWLDRVEEQTGHKIPLHCHTLLRDPAYQSLVNLTGSLKKKALAEVSQLMEKYDDEFNQWNLAKVKKFIEHSEGDSEVFIKGKRYIENFDRIRGLSWHSAAPELGEAWT